MSRFWGMMKTSTAGILGAQSHHKFVRVTEQQGEVCFIGVEPCPAVWDPFCHIEPNAEIR